MDKPVEWERYAPHTERLEVPGGWLFRHRYFGQDPVVMVFVPDLSFATTARLSPDELENFPGGFSYPE